MMVIAFAHRNSQKRIYLCDAWYFVTTTTKDRYPFFREPRIAKLCAQKIVVTKDITPFRLGGYVILPDHMHVLLQPKELATISTILHCMKRNISRSVNILMQSPAGDDDHRRLRRRFRWQKSFHDRIIRDQHDLNIHIGYLRLNPIKHHVARDAENYPWVFVAESLADGWC